MALALGGTTSGALHSCGVCKVRKDDYTDESYMYSPSPLSFVFLPLSFALHMPRGSAHPALRPLARCVCARVLQVPTHKVNGAHKV